MKVRINNKILIQSVLNKFADKCRDVFWIRNSDYSEQIYVSPAYEEVWGHSCAELYENPSCWDSFLHPEDKIKLEASIAKRNPEVSPEDMFVEMYRIIRPDNEIRWIKDQSFPIFSEENELIAFAGIAQDITENKIHEQNLIEAKEKAESANLAKSNFLAVVSHELRTPLNGILGLADILSREPLTNQQLQLVQNIIESSQYLEGIVNDVLDFSVLNAGKLNITTQVVSLYELCRQILLDLSHQLDNTQVSLEFEFDERIKQSVLTDRLRLRQILVNLVGNAIKFTGEGFIRLKVTELESNENTLSVEFSIIDSGPGIPQEKLEMIFDNFTQVDDQGRYIQKKPGVGLGLAICKKLVNLLGGEITGKSKLNEGSAFSFTLNFQIVQKENLISRVIEINKKTDKNKNNDVKILLVEDDKINQKVALHFLKEINYQSDLAEDGASALKLAQKNHYDLVLMDINLPDIDGIEITKRLRKSFSKIDFPIVAMTAHVLPEEKKIFLDAGMNDVITKPVTLDLLKSKVEQWLC